jgi:hypothetical protein
VALHTSDSYFAAGNTNIDTGGEFRFPVNGAGTSIIPRVKSEMEFFKILSCHFDRRIPRCFGRPLFRMETTLCSYLLQMRQCAYWIANDDSTMIDNL